ncbi:hypothetical protein GCM10028786_24790 [Flaviaesturariibacter terrae]
MIFLLSAFLPAAAQTLSTDLPDYPPGATVTLTGSGFAAGEDVTLRVLHASADSLGTDPQYHESWTVTADSAGGFVSYWVVPLDGDAEWATLVATADGLQSGLHAEAVFTDAPQPSCNLSAISGTSARCQGSGQDNYSVTYGDVSGFNWTVSGAGNSISFSNGSATVTWSPTFSGTATITFSINASLCTGPASRTLNVLVTPLTVASTAAAGSGATASAITANWSASANATKYLLDLSTDASFGSFVTAGGKTFNAFDVGNVTTYTITGLTANTTYYYRVRAANSCGSATASGTITYATLPTAPPAPVAAAGSAAACSSFTASWSAAAGATGYFLDVATNSNFNTNFIVSGYNNLSVGAATSVSVTGLTAGNTYFYRVRASNSGGFSGYSSTITYATLPAAPATPGTISGTATPCSGASGVAYSVAAVANASSYTWTLPAGATIATGDGGNSITVNFGSSGGSIAVSASNSCGSSSPRTLAISLNVAPTISGQPAVQSITYGSNASFTVGASGTPAPTYQWQEYISAWNNLSNGGGYSGTSTANLRISLPGVAASGRKYRCTATNSCGSATTNEAAVLTVAPRPITLTADPASKTYGDGDPAFSAQVTSGLIVGTDTHTGTLGRAPGEGAGTYGITQGTYSYGSNYAETFVSALLTINPRPITITADPKTKTYGDPDPALTAQVTMGSIVGTDAASGTLSRTGGENVGRYFIGQGSYTYGGNYLETFVGDSLAIGRRSITLTADASGKIYGDGDPLLTAQVTSGNIVGTDAFTGTLTRAAGEDTGHYAISKGSYTYGNNYSETFTGALFAISQRAITITADATGKTYGNADPALTAQVTAGTIVGTDAASGALQRVGGESAGTYAIAQGTYSYGSNYHETFIGNDFTIGQRPITITADPKNKTYGDPDPAFSAQVTSGSIVGTDAASGSLSRAPGENVGRYAISKGTYSYGANYAETFVRDSLTIGKRPITISADATGKTYGNADPSLTAQVTSGSIVGTDAFTGTLTRAAGEDTGHYAISKGSYTYGNNYSETFAGALFAISQRAITIKADPKNKTYGDPDPAFSAQVTSGSIVGTDAASGSLSRAPGENVGRYAIGQGTYTYGSNYLETYVRDSLTIGRRSITITADPKGKTYGDPDPALTAQVTSGTIVGTDAATGALQRAPGENVGRYAIGKGTYSYGTNYAETFVRDSLTIGRRPITLSADATGKTYGNADPALTARVTAGSIVGTDAASGALTRAAGEDVGAYVISQGTYSYGSNYQETFAGADFSIGQRPLTLNVTAGQHKTYGNADPASFAYTLGAAQSLASWDAFSGSLSRDAGETIGGYPIRQTGLLIKQGSINHTANYSITFNGALFTIDKRSIGITANAKSKSYGSADPALTFGITAGSLAFSDAFRGSLTRAPGEDVGTYAIGQGTVSLDSNYTLSYTGALLTINAASISTYVGVPGPGRRQYSDTLSFRVRIVGGAPRVSGAPGAASSVTFLVGSQTMGTATLTTDGADLVALLPPKKLVEGLNGQMAPGNKTISAVLNSPSANYGLTSVNNTLTDAGFSIDKEDARTEYTGDQIMGTANATAVNATVKLRATLYDITAMTADAAYDTSAGDICKAKVKFVNRDNGADISGWLPVTLVATDGKIGTASFDYPVTLGSTETDREITVGIVVDNGYYIRNSPADNTVITVYKPVGDFITGGGHVVPDKSVGTYRSDSASRTNFGFNVKYNKKGANLQGNMNIIFRRTESDGLHTYQIKANSLQSLGVNASNPGRQTAQFSSKANLTDVTNPAAPIPKGGNKMLYVNMTDRGDPGTQDSISIVLVEGSADPGVLANVLYSSEWLANKNGQKGLRGGNLLVKSGFSVSTTGATVRTVATGEATLSEGAPAASRFGLQAYPNSTAGQFRLLAESDDSRTPLLLRIFDINGRLVQQFTGLAPGSTVEAGSSYAHGSYIAELTQGSRRVTVKLIKE